MSTDLQLEDQLWRLRNLYKCRKEGKGVGIPFVPRPEQEELYRHLIETPHIPAYIIKSRRLGISTAIDIMQADCAVFQQSHRGLIIDKTQADAAKKMVEIVRFAVKSLPAEIAKRIVIDAENNSELRLHWQGEDAAADSAIFAGVGGRGGDCSFLHVSEWGPIAAVDPARSNEIRTGVFPSARLGRRVVETTWYGGKSGDLWDMVKPILANDPNAEGIVYFFPWHSDPEAVRLDGRSSPELEDYFRGLSDRLSKVFSPEQKKWYAAKKIEQGIFIKREYPSTLDEAFSAPIEGAIYGDDIARALAEKRVVNGLKVDESRLVHTAWDLGSPTNTITWYFQDLGHEIRIVDVDIALELTDAERVAHMRGKGYSFGNHYMPHDVKQTARTGRTLLADLTALGLTNIKPVPVCMDIWRGINHLKSIFSTLTFALPHCQEGIDRLNAYRTNTVTKAASTADEPVHDNYASHAADGLRTMAEAYLHGMVPRSLGASRVAAQERKVHTGIGHALGTGKQSGGMQRRVLR